MDERARRVGENEALFRRVNERIRDVNEAFATLTETMDIVCECGDLACAERIRVAPDVYERVRSNPALFLVVPGHDIPEVETVVEAGDAYHVVRKRPGPPEEVARETDEHSS